MLSFFNHILNDINIFIFVIIFNFKTYYFFINKRN